MPAKVLPAPKGFVYFIRAGRTATVKIGWTVNEPAKRLREMQTGCPHTLHLIGFFPADQFEEFRWHERWRGIHLRGEWFALKQGLREAINHQLIQPGSTCYIHIKTDWRAIRKAAA